MTSNCAGQPAGCTVNSATGFDVASFMLGLTQREEPQPVRRRHLHREAPGDRALHAGRLTASTSKLTLNLGLRWDVYVPWVEIDDRQSNFDETHRQVRRRLGRRGHRRRQGRPLPADLLEGRLRPALRLRLRPHRQRQDRRPRRLRHLLELHARRHLVVEGAEPAVPAVHGADADADGLRHQPAAEGRPAGASGRRSEPSGRRARRGRSSTSTSATPTRGSGTSTSSAALGTNYMVEVAYVGSQGRQMLAQGRSEPGAAGRRRDRLERQPAVRRAGAGAADDRPGAEHRHARLQRPAGEVPAAVRATTSRS